MLFKTMQYELFASGREKEPVGENHMLLKGEQTGLDGRIRTYVPGCLLAKAVKRFNDLVSTSADSL